MHAIIKRKRPGMLRRDVIVLHDNTRLLVACTVWNTMCSMLWKVSDHSPYSLDLSPCDFHVFGPLKKVLKGHKFGLEEDIKAVVVQWFQQQPGEFFAEGFHQLVHQWDACIRNHGDYI
jgi:histone-lysine N-methyltransferase SETMAR